MEFSAGEVWFGIIVLFFAIFLIAMLVRIHNALVELRQEVDRAWANIDVILQQRHEEIPQLISICEQCAAYERSTLEKLIEARARYGAVKNTAEKIKTANEISQTMQTVLAIGEAYPVLQSNTQFLHLQSRISGLEDTLADRRELVNGAVTNFNTRCRQFPDFIFATIMSYRPLPLYQVMDSKKTIPSTKIRIPTT